MNRQSKRIDTSGGAGGTLGNNPFEALSAEGLPQQSQPSLPLPKPAALKKAPKRGRVDMRRETKGRGGKTVTTLEFHQVRDPKQLQEICKSLQSRLGIGGTVKGNTILLQGNCRDAAESYLKERNFTPVKAGG